MRTNRIDTLLDAAKIEVKYRYGKCFAGSNLSAAQAQQVLDKLLPVVWDIYRIKRLTLQGYSGSYRTKDAGYYIESENGKEISGRVNTPKEALGACHVVTSALVKYAESRG